MSQMKNKFLEDNGFVKINNSMWRFQNIILQNSYIWIGDTLADRLSNMKKGFKVSYNGAFLSMITTEKELIDLILKYKK